ncbi:MAG: AAA family ATPase [Peptococcaceae bacterium]|nr:AAA family ATPase [Peptococcaceae bacterium]
MGYYINKNLTLVLNQYLEKSGVSIAEAAEAIGFHRTSLSKYLAGKYASNVDEIESKIRAYLSEAGADFKVNVPGIEQFRKRKRSIYESSDATEILGLCQECQENQDIGIIVGRSGFGKTHSLKHYATHMGQVAYVECSERMGIGDMILAIEDVISFASGGTIWYRLESLKSYFNANAGYLLILDEADKLLSKTTQKMIEVIRSLYDRSNFGLVMAGEPALESQIKSYIPRLANRIDYYIKLQGLTDEEVRAYLKDWDITDDAMTELIFRATNQRTGCYRLLDRTMQNVMRVLAARNETKITKDVITEASAMMML